jgi:hypothetical protein
VSPDSAPVSKRLGAPTWSSVGDEGHGVQFYSDDTVLVDVLSGYVGTALITGDASVVFATPAHRDALARCLRARGLDVEVARAAGRYLAFDAADTLGSLLSDGWPDTVRFRTTVGGVLAQAAAAVGGERPRIAVFGEMVALLWAAGQYQPAIRLEELWNDLAETYAFSLCCAYPMEYFKTPTDAAPFLKVCAQHSHVFPAERRAKRRAGAPSALR